MCTAHWQALQVLSNVAGQSHGVGPAHAAGIALLVRCGPVALGLGPEIWDLFHRSMLQLSQVSAS